MSLQDHRYPKPQADVAFRVPRSQLDWIVPETVAGEVHDAAVACVKATCADQQSTIFTAMRSICNGNSHTDTVADNAKDAAPTSHPLASFTFASILAAAACWSL
ncbi:hypothetical protein BKA62DRAFT_775065 [Auriculariales sp. MPI-PUGE-AT-0066]|nr:hypothetical protein BKA62DRAFT_775065 [Auriculariales sp. MPI-PUGE-AT-0066]